MIAANFHFRVTVRSSPFPPQDKKGVSGEFAKAFKTHSEAVRWADQQVNAGKFICITSCHGPLPRSGRPEE